MRTSVLRPLVLVFVVVLGAACGGTPAVTDDIELIVDNLGITHVYAASDRDAFFGAGYAQARDRMFQMELSRRRALGRMSELFGKDTLPVDQSARVMGFGRLGAADATRLRMERPDDMALVESWVAGVNRRIAEVRSGEAPRPYGLRPTELDFVPEDWTPDHAFAVGKLLAFGLSNSLDAEILATALRALAPDASNRLPLALPAYDTYILGAKSGGGTGAGDGNNEKAARATTRSSKNRLSTNKAIIARGTGNKARLAQAPRVPDGWPGASRGLPSRDARKEGPARYLRFASDNGSNNWAVDGAHSQNGRPLLCGDPHQDTSSPSRFWPVHMNSASRGGTLDVIGFAFAGTPSVELGYNDKVAWTATTNFADAMDLWDVELANNEVTLGDGKHAVKPRNEVIRVRKPGGRVGENDDMPLTVIDVPGYGVILPAEILPLPKALLAQGELLFNWTGFRPTREVSAYIALDKARNLDEFERAADLLDVGAVNFVAADATGIDYYVHAAIPDRGDPKTHPMPWRVLDGKDAAGLWTRGDLPASRLPRKRGSERGYIVTANNDPWGHVADGDVQNDEFYYGTFFANGFRAARIEQALGEMTGGGKKVSRADMVTLQADVHSLMAGTVVPLLTEAVGAIGTDSSLDKWKGRTDITDLAARLAKWDRRFARDQGEPVIFIALEWFAAKRAFATQLTEALFETVAEQQSPFFIGQLRNVLTKRFTAADSFMPDGRRALLVGALADTADWLKTRFGGMTNYKLSDYQFAAFPSAYGGALDGGKVPYAGHIDTVMVAEGPAYKGGQPAQEVHIDHTSLYRMAVQFAADGTPEATVSFARGTREDPADRHFADQQTRWADGAQTPLPFRRAEVDAATETRTNLRR